MTCREVSVAVHVHTPAETTRAVEALSRVITGLALEGLDVSLAIEDQSFEPEGDEDEEEHTCP